MKRLITLEYEGQELSFNENAWFNATQAANNFNKSVHEWRRLSDTQKYLNAVIRKYGKTPYLQTKRGNNGGTWLHPKLAVPFAQWLDIDFALWCYEQIDHLLRGSHPIFDKRRLRHQATATYKAISTVLQLSRQQQGKETKPHHYMNEARLINWALKSHFTGLDRSKLLYDELDLLTELEAQDLILIAYQYTFTQRKTALYRFAQNFRANHPNLNCRPNLLEY